MAVLDEHPDEPLREPGGEHRLAGRIVGDGNVGDRVADRLVQLSGDLCEGDRFRAGGGVDLRVVVIWFVGEDLRRDLGHVSRVDHPEPALARVEVAEASCARPRIEYGSTLPLCPPPGLLVLSWP